MSEPDRIWATAYYSQSRSEHVREWSERGYDDRQAYQYVRRDHAVLAALPEVQALIAVALQSIADKARTELAAARAADLIAQWVRNATPADALAARDAMIAEAVAKERHRCILEYARKMLDWVAAEREACAKVAESASTQVFDDAWGPRECAAVMSAMGSIATVIRKRGEGQPCATTFTCIY